MSGDADSARWELDIDVVRGGDGELDFKGRAVHGKHGDRFLYLTWGRLHDGTFDMFRRAKLMLNAVDPQLLAGAAEGRSLVATVRLTDARRPTRALASTRRICSGVSTDSSSSGCAAAWHNGAMAAPAHGEIRGSARLVDRGCYESSRT